MMTSSPMACPRTRRDGHSCREERAGQTLVLPPPANFPKRTAFQSTERRQEFLDDDTRDFKSRGAATESSRCRTWGANQNLDSRSSTEWRKMVAHGVSRGEPCALAKSPARGDRVGSRRTFFRRFAAQIFNTQPTADAVGHPLAAASQLSTAAIKNGFAPQYLIQQPWLGRVDRRPRCSYPDRYAGKKDCRN